MGRGRKSENSAKNFNPFEETPQKIESLFDDWGGLYSAPYDKHEIEPFTRVRVLLAASMEARAIALSHSLHLQNSDNDLRRELALLRRIEQQQQKRIASLKPLDESVLETTVIYEQLAVELTASLAQMETHKYIKSALDFALLEDFDHLYRFSDLLEMEQGKDAGILVGGYTEIMPGRPTISSHRHPFDDVKRALKSSSTVLQSKLNMQMVFATEWQTMNFYNQMGAFGETDISRKLYAEIGMVEEQHVTQYGSILDADATPLARLLFHEFAECYLYFCLHTDETDSRIKRVWEYHLEQEITHLHRARALLNKYENRDYFEIVGDGVFPAILSFGQGSDRNRDYIRLMLRRTADDTAVLEEYAAVKSLPADYQFFRYNNTVNSSLDAVASHKLIDNYIAEFGEDFRFEESAHPVPSLRNRKKDNTDYGRQ